MIHSLPLSRIRTATLLAISGILGVSCGSYQQASYYDNDGIYESENVRVVERAPQQVQKKKEHDPYSDYFGQKADEYGEILDSEVFTDVDSYSSETEYDSIPQKGDLTDYYQPENDYEGYGGWGDNATDVSINIYDNGWNNWGYGGGFGWGSNNPWLWNNWGYGGYNGWGWNNPWRWNRWNNWGYGGYYGLGYGWGGYYGYGYGYYGNSYYNGYYGNSYYGRNGYNSYGYNRSRRGYYNSNTIASNSAARNLRGRSNVNTRGTSPRYRSNSSTSRVGNARSSANTRSSNTLEVILRLEVIQRHVEL